MFYTRMVHIVSAWHAWRERQTEMGSPLRPNRVPVALGIILLSPSMEVFEAQRHAFKALQQTFVVDSDYQFHKELGQGKSSLRPPSRSRPS